MIYIFWTCSNTEEAKRIIHALIEKSWIACATIFPEVTSIYQWNNQINEDTEVKVVLKSQKTHFSRIEKFISQQASYEVPEIVSVCADKVHAPYKKWLDEVISD